MFLHGVRRPALHCFGFQALLVLALVALTIAPCQPQVTTASFSLVSAAAPNSTLQRPEGSSIVVPYSIQRASVLSRGSQRFVCFGDGYCETSTRSLCKSCLVWDFSRRNWTDSILLSTSKLQDVSLTQLSVNETIGVGGINSTGSISADTFLIGSLPTNLTVSSFETTGSRWSTVIFPAPNGTFAWGGCVRLRDYPPVGTTSGVNFAGKDPICFNDLWFRHMNGSWERIIASTGSNAAFGPKGQFSPTYAPGPRLMQSHTIDSNGDLWMFGGMKSFANTYYADLWKFSVTARQWAWMGGAPPNETRMDNFVWDCREGTFHDSNFPAGRQHAALWWDSTRSALFLHGGNLFWEDMNTAFTMSDLWMFNPMLSQWSFVAGSFWSINSPNVTQHRSELPRMSGHAALVDPSNSSRIILFGGLGVSRNRSGILADTWEISLSSKPNTTMIPGCPNYSDKWTEPPKYFSVAGSGVATANSVFSNLGTTNWALRYSPSYPNGFAWMERPGRSLSWDDIYNLTLTAKAITRLSTSAKYDLHMPYVMSNHEQRQMMSVSDDFGGSYILSFYFFTGARDVGGVWKWIGGGPANGTIISDDSNTCYSWCGWINGEHLNDPSENCAEMSQLAFNNWNDLNCSSAPRSVLFMYTCTTNCTAPFKISPSSCECRIPEALGCSGVRPGPDWYCDTNVQWNTIPGATITVNATTPPLRVDTRVIVVTTNLTITNGSVLFSSPRNRIETSGTGCVNIQGGIVRVDVSAEDLSLLNNTAATLVSGCVEGQFSNVSILGSTQCANVQADQQKTTAGLAILFSISSVASCNPATSNEATTDAGVPTWAIIVAVLGGVIIILAIILAVTLSGRLRRIVRPYSRKNRETQQE